MAELNNILIALGVDSTLWIQLGVFVIIFTTALHLVFKPYFKSYLERQNRTTGNRDKAEQIFAQTRELEALYQRKMRGLTADIKSIYDKARNEAEAENEKIQTEAREKAKTILDKARNKIEIEYNKAREELIKQAPELGQSIANQLISQEVQK